MKKMVKKRSSTAQALESPSFRQRVVPDHKKYKRKKSFNHIKEYYDDKI